MWYVPTFFQVECYTLNKDGHNHHTIQQAWPTTNKCTNMHALSIQRALSQAENYRQVFSYMQKSLSCTCTYCTSPPVALWYKLPLPTLTLSPSPCELERDIRSRIRRREFSSRTTGHGWALRGEGGSTEYNVNHKSTQADFHSEESCDAGLLLHCNSP